MQVNLSENEGEKSSGGLFFGGRWVHFIPAPKILGELKEISQKQDLAEPFDRIKNTVTQVHKQELNHQSVNHSHKAPQPS